MMNHCVLYFKFNGLVYNKFPVDLWESLCDFIDGKRETTFFLNWMMTKMQLVSNLNHSCPFTNFIIKTNNISLDEAFTFDQSILPSGRYRVDITFADENRVPLLDMSLYGTIAEHYLEKI
ncbi:hypothetical protein HA402_001264 [Bradysia odoriphaga]|nr:hypothetical protein HA402_001264 [Bradysia odoriphaga]